jgi:hypothetical protein
MSCYSCMLALHNLLKSQNDIKLKQLVKCNDSSAPQNVMAPKNLLNGVDHFL